MSLGRVGEPPKCRVVISSPQDSPGLHLPSPGEELFRIHCEEMYQIPTVAFTGSSRGIFLNRNNVKNQPFHESREHYGTHTLVYFFEDGMDNLNHPGNKSKYSKNVSFIA